MTARRWRNTYVPQIVSPGRHIVVKNRAERDTVVSLRSRLTRVHAQIATHPAYAPDYVWDASLALADLRAYLL